MHGRTGSTSWVTASARIASGNQGRWFTGASPSKKSVQRLKDKLGAILVPGNKGPWEEVRGTLNRLLRGWCGYFSPGSHYATDRAIEAHLYDRVRNFLVRRHKMPTRGIGLPAHKASPIELSAEHERELNALVPGAFNATKTGGTGADHFAGRNRPWSRRDGPATGDLAQDGKSLATPLAGCGGIRRRGGAFERRAALRCAGDVHARGDLPDHGPGL